MLEPAKKYFAFVSYNSADRQEAEKLQRQIERYRLPAIIREEVSKKTATPCPSKLSPIFRDITDLSVGPLSELLRKELEQSRYLIVICSPNAAKSNWVNREAEHFTKMGWYDRIIPYIIADDKTLGFNACCPPILRDPPEFQDDTSLDLTKEEHRLKNEESKNTLRQIFAAPEMEEKVPLKGVSLIHESPAHLKVIARMLEVSPDMLIQRDAEYQRRMLKRWIYAIASLAIVFMGITAVAIYHWQQATEQRQIAEANERLAVEQREEAEGLVRLLMNEGMEIANASWAGAGPFLRRVDLYQEKWGITTGADRAQHLMNLGNADNRRVNPDMFNKRKHYEEALKIWRQLTKEEPHNDNWQQKKAESLHVIGRVLISNADLAGAEKYYEEALEIVWRLIEKDPNNECIQLPYIASLCRSLLAIGEIFSSNGDLTSAQRFYEEALAIERYLTEREWGENVQRPSQRELAGILETLGNVLATSGNLTGAQKYYDEASKIRQQLPERDNLNEGIWK